MSRLRLAACAVLLAAAPAPSGPAAPRDELEERIFSAALSQVKVGCEASPTSCAELTAIQKAYMDEYKKLGICPSKECDEKFVDKVYAAVEALDARESELPEPARSDGIGRPLLRLSLRVTALAYYDLKAAAPGAKPPFRFDPKVDGPRAVEHACLVSPDACADARASLFDARSLNELMDSCDAKRCDFKDLDAAAEVAEAAEAEYERASSHTTVNTLALFSLVTSARGRLFVHARRDALAKADLLVSGSADFATAVDRYADGAGDPVALEARYNEVSDLFRMTSLNSDRTAAFAISQFYDPPARERINAAAARLASARAKLFAVETARGFDAKAAATRSTLVAGASGAAKRALDGTALVAATPPTLLDRRLVPAPPPRDPPAPPIIPGDRSLREIAVNIFSDDPTRRADARRRAKMSYTVGDPGGLAQLVHHQTHPDTCAVVSQQQVLALHRLVSRADPVKVEDELRERALRRGFYREGTPDAYTAELLIDKGLLVTKRTGAPIGELDAAVRRGGPVIANVDARYLWSIPAAAKLGHAIVITGAEVDVFTGKTVGYYINDSGKDPPGRGDFIPLETFKKAWDGHTKSFAEVR